MQPVLRRISRSGGCGRKRSSTTTSSGTCLSAAMSRSWMPWRRASTSASAWPVVGVALRDEGVSLSLGSGRTGDRARTSSSPYHWGCSRARRRRSHRRSRPGGPIWCPGWVRAVREGGAPFAGPSGATRAGRTWSSSRLSPASPPCGSSIIDAFGDGPGPRLPRVPLRNLARVRGWPAGGRRWATDLIGAVLGSPCPDPVAVAVTSWGEDPYPVARTPM